MNASEHVKVHVKSHVGHLKRPHGKTASMEELAALAEQLSWSADELQECLRAFGGCMAETAQHMEAQLDLVGRDDEDEEKGGRICTALRFSKTWWENWWAKLAYYYALQVGIRLKIVQIGISFEQSGILTI